MALVVPRSTAAVSGNSVTTITATFATNTGVGSLLVAQCSSFGALAATPVSDLVGGNTNTWTALTTQTSGSISALIAYSANIANAGATHMVKLSCTSNNYPSLVCSEVTGAATASVVDQENGATQATGTSHTSGDITTANADDILFGVGNAASGVTQTEDAAFTATANITTSGSAESITAGYRIVSATGTYNRTWTSSGNTVAVNRIAAFKAAAAVATAARRLTLLGAGA